MSRLRAFLSFLRLKERPRMVKPEADPRIAEVRRELARGNWMAAAELLGRRGSWSDRERLVRGVTDWAGRPEWLDEWVKAKRSAEAYLVRGVHSVGWAWEARGRGSSDTLTKETVGTFLFRLKAAQKDLAEAARLAPADPTPWAWLVTCARGLELGDETSRAYFDEAVQRDARNYRAHEQMLQNLSEKWGGEADTMFAHARAASAKDRPGGALHELIVIAHMEHGRMLDGMGGSSDEYLKSSVVRRELLEAANRSVFSGVEADEDDRLRAQNIFAMAFCSADEHDAATALFNQIRGRMTDVWGSFYRRPAWVFSAFRASSAFNSKPSRVWAMAEKVSAAAESYHRWKKIAGVVALIALIIFAALHRIGPTSAAPSEYPTERMEKKWGEHKDNARPFYTRAGDALTPPPEETWTKAASRVREPLPEKLKEWLSENEPVMENIRRGVAKRACYLRVARIDEIKPGKQEASSRMRELVRFVALRAREAAERRDLERFNECMMLMLGMSRHLMSHELVVPYMNGLAGYGLTLDFVLWPLEWPELAAEAKAEYVERVSNELVEPPALTNIVRNDTEEFALFTMRAENRFLTWIASEGRVMHEFERASAPMMALAAAPIEQQLDVMSEVRLAAGAKVGGANWLTATYNLPRYLAQLSNRPTMRVVELRGRVVAMQRGVGTALAVHRFRIEKKKWPASLSALSPPPGADPYSGEPLVHKAKGDGFSLYCRGVDRDDDGGKHDGRFGEKQDANKKPLPPDGDYVFWPLDWKPAEEGERRE